MKTSNGLTVDDGMETLNCTRSYVYKLVRNGELEAIDGTMPVRVDVDSLIFKIKKLYPWIVSICRSKLHYELKQMEHNYSH